MTINSKDWKKLRIPAHYRFRGNSAFYVFGILIADSIIFYTLSVMTDRPEDIMEIVQGKTAITTGLFILAYFFAKKTDLLLENLVGLRIHHRAKYDHAKNLKIVKTFQMDQEIFSLFQELVVLRISQKRLFWAPLIIGGALAIFNYVENFGLMRINILGEKPDTVDMSFTSFEGVFALIAGVLDVIALAYVSITAISCFMILTIYVITFQSLDNATFHFSNIAYLNKIGKADKKRPNRLYGRLSNFTNKISKWIVSILLAPKSEKSRILCQKIESKVKEVKETTSKQLLELQQTNSLKSQIEISDEEIGNQGSTKDAKSCCDINQIKVPNPNSLRSFRRSASRISRDVALINLIIILLLLLTSYALYYFSESKKISEGDVFENGLLWILASFAIGNIMIFFLSTRPFQLIIIREKENSIAILEYISEHITNVDPKNARLFFGMYMDDKLINILYNEYSIFKHLINEFEDIQDRIWSTGSLLQPVFPSILGLIKFNLINLGRLEPVVHLFLNIILWFLEN